MGCSDSKPYNYIGIRNNQIIEIDNSIKSIEKKNIFIKWIQENIYNVDYVENFILSIQSDEIMIKTINYNYDKRRNSLNIDMNILNTETRRCTTIMAGFIVNKNL